MHKLISPEYFSTLKKQESDVFIGSPAFVFTAVPSQLRRHAGE
jgi:hypothetical protein